MWAVVSIRHDNVSREELEGIFRDFFRNPLSRLDALNDSRRFSDLSDREKTYFAGQTVYSMRRYSNALLIFLGNSQTDLEVQVEIGAHDDLRELKRTCDALVPDIVRAFKPRRIKLISKDPIVVRFYSEGGSATNVVGRYQSYWQTVKGIFNGHGILWGLFSALLAIGIWIYNKGVTIETVRLSLGTIALVPLFVLVVAFFRKEKIVWIFEK